MSQTIVITGAGRGIGLELARAWQRRGEHVIGVCRRASAALQALGITVVDGIDVGADAAMPRLRAALADQPIDVLINNAGVMGGETLEDMDMDSIRQQFEVNTLGPLRVTLALLDNMAAGSKIGLITARIGSIADNDSGRKYGYRISKAGLNAAGKSLAIDLKPQDIAVAILHPGYVQTDMTDYNGQLSPEQSAHRLIQRMDELKLENTGTFWHCDGSVLPW